MQFARKKKNYAHNIRLHELEEVPDGTSDYIAKLQIIAILYWKMIDNCSFVLHNKKLLQFYIAIGK